MSSKSKTSETKEEAKSSLVPKLRFPEFRETKWDKKKIGSMLIETSRPIELEDETEYNLVTVKRRYGGLVSRGKLKGREIKVTTQFLVHEGDFLISKRQIVHDACGIVPETLDGAVVSNEYSVLTPKAGCSVEFINWFAQQPCVSRSFLQCSVGIVIEKMLFKLDAWLKREFLFPGLPEQQRIAECLSSVDELIAAQARKVDALKTHKKGLMQQLFPREGETQPRLRFPEFQEAWRETRLEDHCVSISSGKDHSDPDGAYDLFGSTGVIGKTDSATFHSPRLLVARVGANAGFLTMAEGQFGVTDNTLIVSPRSSTNLTYIFYYLGNIRLNKLIFGSGQPLITGGILKNLPISVPDKSEQERISKCLVAIDEAISAEGNKLETLKSHKKGLMQQLFPSMEEVEA